MVQKKTDKKHPFRKIFITTAVSAVVMSPSMVVYADHLPGHPVGEGYKPPSNEQPPSAQPELELPDAVNEPVQKIQERVDEVRERVRVNPKPDRVAPPQPEIPQQRESEQRPEKQPVPQPESEVKEKESPQPKQQKQEPRPTEDKQKSPTQAEKSVDQPQQKRQVTQQKEPTKQLAKQQHPKASATKRTPQESIGPDYIVKSKNQIQVAHGKHHDDSADAAKTEGEAVGNGKESTKEPQIDVGGKLPDTSVPYPVYMAGGMIGFLLSALGLRKREKK